MIKDHAQAVELLTNCIPFFSTCKSIDFSNQSAVTFTWYGNKYLLDLINCHVHQITGHIFDTNSATMLMSSLIKKQIELNSKS